MNVTLEDDARQDLRDSFHFYEEYEPGAGWHFLDKMQAELQTLGGFGGVHRQRFSLHFYASKRFPHGVFTGSKATPSKSPPSSTAAAIPD